MITIATLLWAGNRFSQQFSTMYDESWVEKLYRGFERNLSQPFDFVCYVDRERKFEERIIQRKINSLTPGYGDCIQPYEMNTPMILCGLDTVVIGNVDHLANYCLWADKIALPRDPYVPHQACNGVALVPHNQRKVWSNWRGDNDMVHMRNQPHAFIDDLFPGHVVSYKGHVKEHGLDDARIVYFHGMEKPHELPKGHEILRSWV